MKYHKTVTSLSILLWALIILAGISVFFAYDLSIETVIFWAKSFVEQNMILWITIFIIAYIVRPLFFIPATPFDLFSGMVLGPWLWFLISFVSTLFTSMFGYVVWVLTGGIFIKHKKKDKKRFEKLKKQLYENTFFTTMMMRLMLLPYDLTNYICGLLRIPFFRFVWGTMVGVLPTCFIFVSAGAAFYGKNITSYQTLTENINYTTLIFSSVLLIWASLFARYLKKRYKEISL